MIEHRAHLLGLALTGDADEGQDEHVNDAVSHAVTCSSRQASAGGNAWRPGGSAGFDPQRYAVPGRSAIWRFRAYTS